MMSVRFNSTCKPHLQTRTHICLEQNLPGDIWCTEVSGEIYFFDKSVNTAANRGMKNSQSNQSCSLTVGLLLGFWSSQVLNLSQAVRKHNRQPQCPPASTQHLPPPFPPCLISEYTVIWQLSSCVWMLKVQPQVWSCSERVCWGREGRTQNKRTSCIVTELINVK